jgi:N utilization substance protein A
VQRFDRGDIVVNLGNTEGVLPRREQVPRESYRRGDRVRALILDVLHDTKGPQILLTRTHPDFLVLLFKTEVPEISEGVVTIMGAAREPGSRAKFAVASNDSDIDPVGACVGMKGSRVQNVVQELRGEKIDIIPWHLDAARYVCNSLAPADISRVIIDEDSRTMEVIVPDDSLSVAIGKRGQNVRLASRLTGWHLDVKSETDYNQDMKDGYDSLLSLPEMTTGLADALYEKGLYSAEELASCSEEELMQVRDLSEAEATALIESARAYVLDKENAAAEESETADESGEETVAGDSPGTADDPQEETVAEDADAVEEAPAAEDDPEAGDDESSAPKLSE